MKRKVLSFFVIMALCLNLCPVWILAVEDDDSFPSGPEYILYKDKTFTSVCEISGTMIINTQGYTLTGSNSSTLRVTETGVLDLRGKVVSNEKDGVEVMSGGSLTVTAPGTDIQGEMYALNIAAGASVSLSTGTYFGKKAAICVEDGDFDALLADGYAYFDEKGAPIPPESMAKTRTVVVGRCKDQPVLTWDTSVKPVPVEVDYDGEPVEASSPGRTGDLPPVSINIKSTEDNLQDYLQYSFKKAGDSGYTDGLPKDAGTYDVIVSLPEMQNYEAAVSEPITLVIRQINPIVTPPAAAKLVYNGAAQELVTAGTLAPAAARDNLKIKFAASAGGPFSETIPTEVNAGDYEVWYTVEVTNNYLPVTPVKINDVKIERKRITPFVTLSQDSYLYDGEFKKPSVTVRDRDDMTVLWETEYQVEYINNQNVSTAANPAKVIVSNKDGGNYIVDQVEVKFEITSKTQESLSITQKPDTITYGSQFTLETLGGSDSGNVTWKITSGNNVATVDENSGQVTVIDCGKATVQATKSGGGNYEDAAATWEFTAVKRPITAIVTADNRVYVTGDKTAAIHVTWKEGDLVGTDKINTSGLSGEFEDDSAGVNKTVKISGTYVDDTTAQKYDITIPSITTASILKADTTAPILTGNTLEYDGSAQALVSGGNTGTTLYSDARNGEYFATVPTGTDAGIYTVWYKETGDTNHNDSEPQWIQVTVSPKPLTADITNTTLSGSDLKTDTAGGTTIYYYEYDGADKTPSVTIKDGAVTVPASEYTVSYSGNKNVGEAAVSITDNANGNYAVSGSVKFEIRQTGAQLTSSPQAVRDLIYTGQPQELVTVGTAVGGHIEYALDNGSFGKGIPKTTNAGTYTVTYKVVADGNHSADSTTTGSVTVTISPKQVVSPEITVSGSYTYDGTEHKPLAGAVTVKDDGTIIPSGEYTLSYRNNVNAGTATVIVSDKNAGNYTVNGTAAFEIERAVATSTAPTNLGNPYNNTEQELVQAGGTSDGTMVYSLSNTGTYSPDIPTGKAVGSYPVWYKVLGDSNHKDSAPASVSASIVMNTVTNPTIQVTPESAAFNGETQKPTVTIQDDRGFAIDSSEYTVTYTDASNTPVTEPKDTGTYTLTIASTGSNYSFTTNATFEILAAGQIPLTITGTQEKVCYGDTIQLGTTGGSGTVTWSVSGPATVAANGLLTVNGVGSVTVTATSSAAGYADQTATWSVYAQKKPVNAVVTAAEKTYDGAATTTVTATLQGSDLVGSDKVRITLTGKFEDPNAGMDKKVNIDSSNPNFAGSTGNYGNYAISYPAFTTASILKADITNVTLPTPASLEYTGEPLTLVTAGSSTEGTMEYSLDNNAYSAIPPTGVNAGDYEVYYRVKGDNNHNDTTGTKLANKVTIAPQTVTPIIELTPGSALYDGGVHKPAVTVKDKNYRVIPEGEYNVDYGSTDWKTVGNHTVKITDKTGGNYSITDKSETFTITQKDQPPLTISGQPNRVQYGDAPFQLTASGGSGTGAVTWRSSNESIAAVDENSGWVTILKSGSVTITATRAADGNYGEASVSWPFSVERKPVTPVITLSSSTPPYTYSGVEHRPSVTVTAEGRTLGAGEYTTAYSDNINAGTATVTVQNTSGCDYQFTGTATFVIEKATPTITNLTASGTEGQPLSSCVLNCSADVSGTFAWTNDSIVPADGDPCEITFTPTDTNNYKPVTLQIIVTVNPASGGGSTSGNSGGSSDTNSTPSADTNSIPMRTTVQNGTANTVLSASAGSRLVSQAVANQSQNIVIKPEITGDVTKAQVSIPASTVSQIQSKTNAALTVSAPIADVTIPNAALDTLSSAGGTVDIMTEQVDRGVALTLTAGGEKVEDVPGGLTLTVPAENAGPGTVAMLVHEDGTRETIRKSVAKDGAVDIPLNGSATVEIVDNSKAFSDVPPENWAADAVAFASAHELFNGTGETTFSPDQDMSRGMLATVLYNLEGRPDQDAAGEFSDVSSEAWYADSVAWATENGITSGYGDGQFGPDDSVTREQLAVMLWRYAGSPEASGRDLAFTDADQVSGYARGALCWAVEKGILSGYADGQLAPGKTATRVQAAQMLKSFMENA